MHVRIFPHPNNSNGTFSLKAVAMLFGFALLVDTSPCTARAYRCTDAGGNVSYSQSPCAASQTGARVYGVGTTTVRDREACTLVRSFATESFGKLQRGTEPSTLISKYGGPGYIDPITLNVINFVSGFRFSTEVPASKVGGLAYNKCKSGGFGKIQTSDLPVEILPHVDEVDEATESPTPMQFPSQSAPAAERYSRNKADDNSRQQLCQDYDQRLDELNRAMRRGYDAGNGQRIRKERQQYETLLRKNCRE